MSSLSLSRAGDAPVSLPVVPGPSQPDPRTGRDATGNEFATVTRTQPVAGGTWCNGGLGIAVTGPLGRMRVRAVGKKPCVEGVDALVS